MLVARRCSLLVARPFSNGGLPARTIGRPPETLFVTPRPAFKLDKPLEPGHDRPAQL